MRRVGCGDLVTPPRSTPAVMLNFFGDWVRCISLYLCGVKVAPWWCAHPMQLWWTCSRTWQLFSVLLPTTSILTSSTNLMPNTLPVLCVQKSTSSLLKNRNRIGETGDPCGMLVETLWVSPCHCPRTREVWRSARKLAVHRTSAVGTLSHQRMCSRWLCDMLGKAATMSRPQLSYAKT